MKFDLIPIGVQFTFDASFKSNSKRVRFYQLLYGGKFSSKFSRYSYERKGVISDIDYLKPTKSTIIVSLKNAFILRKFFKKYRVRFSENIVVLHHEQARKLGVESNNKWKNLYYDVLGKEDLLITLDF